MGAAVEGKLPSDVLQLLCDAPLRRPRRTSCCFCCALLGEELNKWATTASGNGYHRPQFVLPGRHGIIYPWYPPSGLPTEVLRNMAGTLEQVLDSFLPRNGPPEPGSTQTSPTISVKSFELPRYQDVAKLPFDF
ncbi:hypothetical protein C8Q80DRAFT_1213205 [Daedaleopsis nitida]|nr:hypothetical protein C8Q80DRAFT_1213205 [Daedaleopsis nitida]